MKKTVTVSKNGFNKTSRRITLTEQLKKIGAYDDDDVMTETLPNKIVITRIK